MHMFVMQYLVVTSRWTNQCSIISDESATANQDGKLNLAGFAVS